MKYDKAFIRLLVSKWTLTNWRQAKGNLNNQNNYKIVEKQEI
jgi:hypothetical protein